MMAHEKNALISTKTNDFKRKFFFSFYFIIFIVFLGIGPRVFSSTGIGSSDFHSWLNISSSFPAFISAIACLIYYLRLKNRYFLIVGLGLFICGNQNLIHGILDFTVFFENIGLDLSKSFPAGYAAGRLLFSMMIIIAIFSETNFKRVKKIRYEFFFCSAMTFLAATCMVLIIFFVPLPRLIYPENIISRPFDLFTGGVLILAFISVLRRYLVHQDIFSGMLLACILLNIGGEVYMSFSRQSYDRFFNVAHWALTISYLMPTLGFSIQGIMDELEERVKALNCLYGISSLFEKKDISLANALEGTAAFIIAAFRYPEITAVRILLNDIEYKTDDFKKCSRVMTENIMIDNKPTGSIDVCYLEEKSIISKENGPFLNVEKELLKDISLRLAAVMEQRNANQQIKHVNAVLRAIRSIDHIITRENDLQCMIQKICRCFIEIRGYLNAWIILIDEMETVSGVAQAGINETDLNTIKQKVGAKVPNCFQMALNQPGIVFVSDAIRHCPEGCLFRAHQKKSIHIRLESNTKVYGILSVSLSKEVTRNDDELELLLDAANDIGYGLYNAEIMEKRNIAEKALIKARDDAETANRSKSDFLASMSHEIRTPMNAIIGMTEMCLETKLTDEQNYFLTRVLFNTEALLGLINDILDFSKLEAGQLELEKTSFDLVTMVEDVAELISVRARGKNVEIIPHVEYNMPRMVTGDKNRLRQILINLSGNAEKFTEKGEVVIKTQVEPLDNSERIRIRFDISDTGIGISPKNQAKIFNRFIQADASTTRQYGGTGLGLSISQGLVQLMGGTITIESKENVGSCFYFTLDMDISKEAEHEFHHPEFKDISILVVDDNPTNRFILEKMLSLWEFQVEAVTSGMEAISLLEKSATTFDLVILDYQMPGMNGVETADMIRKNPKNKNTGLMILSSIGLISTDQLKAHDIMVSLTKPVKQSDLLNTLMRIFRIKVDKTPQKDFTDDNEQKISAPREEIKILLVEDNPDNQKLAMLFMKNENYAIDKAENGQQAVEAVMKNQYDLILMDIQMPVLDGFRATESIRVIEKKEKRARVPIVALTAHAVKGYQEKCFAHGMDDFITKPIKKKKLIETIQKHTQSPAEEKMIPEKKRISTGAKIVVDVDMDLEDLIPGFIENRHKDTISIRNALKENDFDIIRTLGHSMKGSGGGYGFDEISKIGKLIEASARNGNIDEINKQTDALSSYLEKVEVKYI